MMRIVPSILTDRRKDLRRLLNQAMEFAEYVQIDFMDGRFVPSESVSPADLRGITTTVPCEAHLMVEHPEQFLPDLVSFGFRRIIFHIEAKTDALTTIRSIKQHRCEVGVALNPETNLTHVDGLISEIDSVLFLAVNPGFYGSPFIPEVLDKIRRFRHTHRTMVVGIDGGVALDNIVEIKALGVSYACVGSRVMLSENPGESYRRFRERAMGQEE
jgi:ribulose-phosphate 3-epimerase